MPSSPYRGARFHRRIRSLSCLLVMRTEPFVFFSLVLSIYGSMDSLRAQELPVVVVDRDDTKITASCRVEFPPNAVISDPNNNGVLHIEASDITVEFGPGRPLWGSLPSLQNWDQMQGFGIRIQGQTNVHLRNLQVHGFRGGLWASAADGLRIEGANVSDNFRQRLLSTPQAEVGSDWLWPHENDENQWLNQYGAGIYIEDSRNVEISGVRARRVQNGICLDRVRESKVYDNDCSFLSGWGLALWRCEKNVISRNAFDFCVRGYSHGVYSRGQDSAGILCFEQCSENIIAENSATHSGDGFFGFTGRESLGENPPPSDDFDYHGRGCNNNLLIRNDFSYAPAIGIEMTFSFGNRFYENKLVGSNYGVWGGYSQETLIYGNTIADNSLAGIAIEHGSNNFIVANQFRHNRRGVELWWDVDEGLFRRAWVQANHKGITGNRIAHNSFSGDQVGVELRRTGLSDEVPYEMGTVLVENSMEDVGQDLNLRDQAIDPEFRKEPFRALPLPQYPVYGKNEPIGARAHLDGRDKIVMTEWGPWDHESPLVRLTERMPDGHLYLLHGLSRDIEIREIESGEVKFELSQNELKITGRKPGFHAYAAELRASNFQGRVEGRFLLTEWDITVFPWEIDPREDLDGWRKLALGKEAREAKISTLDLPYASGGPSHLDLSEEINRAQMAGDRFGTIASTRLFLQEGRWRVETLSDDGVRVLINKNAVIDNWTWHAPTTDEGVFVQTRDGYADILVEHFEIDGYATLRFEITPLE